MTCNGSSRARRWTYLVSTRPGPEAAAYERLLSAPLVQAAAGGRAITPSCDTRRSPEWAMLEFLRGSIGLGGAIGGLALHTHRLRLHSSRKSTIHRSSGNTSSCRPGTGAGSVAIGLPSTVAWSKASVEIALRVLLNFCNKYGTPLDISG